VVIERLAQVIVEPGAQSLISLRGLIMRGERDHLFPARVLLRLRQDFETGAIREADVADQDLERRGLEELQCFLHIARPCHLVPGPPEQPGQDRPCFSMILNQ